MSYAPVHPLQVPTAQLHASIPYSNFQLPYLHQLPSWAYSCVHCWQYKIDRVIFYAVRLLFASEAELGQPAASVPPSGLR